MFYCYLQNSNKNYLLYMSTIIKLLSLYSFCRHVEWPYSPLIGSRVFITSQCIKVIIVIPNVIPRLSNYRLLAVISLNCEQLAFRRVMQCDKVGRALVYWSPILQDQKAIKDAGSALFWFLGHQWSATCTFWYFR